MGRETINDIYQRMLFNPEFSKFVKENENKSIEEIAIDYDIKIDLVRECHV